MSTPDSPHGTPDSTGDGDAYEPIAAWYDLWITEVVDDLPWYRSICSAEARGLQSSNAANSAQSSSAAASQLGVVEVGAGSGRVAVALASDGHRIEAIEPSAELATRCMKRCERAGVASSVTMHGCRAQDAHIGNASAGVVIAPFRTMLHLVDDMPSLLSGIRSWLTPGGVIAFDVAHDDDATRRELDGIWLRRETAASPVDQQIAVHERATWRGHGDETRMRLDVRVTDMDDIELAATSMDLALPGPSWWHDQLQQAGFVDIQCFETFDNRRVDAALTTSTDTVWRARAPRS